MLNYHVKIGLVPIRRDVTPRPGIFNWEKAQERCAEAVAYIEEHFTSENVSFVDLRGINEVDVLYSDKDVDAVIDRFRTTMFPGLEPTMPPPSPYEYSFPIP